MGCTKSKFATLIGPNQAQDLNSEPHPAFWFLAASPVISRIVAQLNLTDTMALMTAYPALMVSIIEILTHPKAMIKNADFSLENRVFVIVFWMTMQGRLYARDEIMGAYKIGQVIQDLKPRHPMASLNDLVMFIESDTNRQKDPKKANKRYSFQQRWGTDNIVRGVYDWKVFDSTIPRNPIIRPKGRISYNDYRRYQLGFYWPSDFNLVSRPAGWPEIEMIKSGSYTRIKVTRRNKPKAVKMFYSSDELLDATVVTTKIGILEYFYPDDEDIYQDEYEDLEPYTNFAELIDLEHGHVYPLKCEMPLVHRGLCDEDVIVITGWEPRYGKSIERKSRLEVFDVRKLKFLEDFKAKVCYGPFD